MRELSGRGAARQANIAAATEELQDLRLRLAGAKARLRGAAEIDLQVASILERHHVVRYLVVKRTVREEHQYKQARRGRPGPGMGTVAAVAHAHAAGRRTPLADRLRQRASLH